MVKQILIPVLLITLARSIFTWSCNYCQLPEEIKKLKSMDICTELLSDKAKDGLAPEFIARNFDEKNSNILNNQLIVFYRNWTFISDTIHKTTEPRLAHLYYQDSGTDTAEKMRYMKPVASYSLYNSQDRTEKLGFFTTTEHYSLRIVWNAILDKSNRKDCDTQPILCDKEYPSLKEVLFMPANTSKYGYLVAFFDPSRSDELTRRSLKVKIWRMPIIDDPLIVPEPEFVYSTTYTGYMAAAEIYKLTKENMMGFYATVDGNVCHFTKPRNLESPKDLLFEDLSEPRSPCMAIDMFVGCPMPWCFDNRFETSFTVKHLTTGETTIYIKKLEYAWKVREQNLPFEVPRQKDAIYLYDDSSVDSPSRCESITSNITDPCIPRYADSSFGFTHQDLQYIWFTEGTRNRWTLLPYQKVFNLALVTKSNLSQTWDAQWYNSFERKAYFFTGNRVIVLGHQHKGPPPPTFKKVSEISLAVFGIEEDHVDSIISTKDAAYIFVDSFYYRVPEMEGRFSGHRSKILSFETFFKVKESCYGNNMKQFDELVQRYKGKDKFEVTQVISESPKSETDKPESWEITLLYVMVIISGCITGILVVFTVYRERQKQHKDGKRTKHRSRKALQKSK